MGLIPEDVIGEIRTKADIVEVVGRYVELRKAGVNHKGLCPFHNEKTPSFNVNSAKGFFYCFGCHKKGDAFTFLMEYEGKSFVEAAESLASSVGVTIEKVESAQANARRSERAEMFRLNELATQLFQRILHKDPLGEPGRRYLASRGIKSATAEAFRLGYAPNDWRVLTDRLTELGSHLERASALGLIGRQRQKGGYYDRFRGRLMCPVIAANDDITGFSGRIIEGPEDTAKYINSPESLVYKKSKLLFGLHRARDGFRRNSRAVLVEGNFDVLAMHQAELTETVAPLGTAMTEDQADLLRRFVGQVVLLFDGDAAGGAAALKALKILVGAELDVRVAVLPKGEDPDSILRKSGKPVMEQILDRAQPGIEFFAYEVWSSQSDSAFGRAKALEQAAAVVKSVKDNTKRDLICGTLASAMGMEISAVRRAIGRASHTPGEYARPSTTRPPNQAASQNRRVPPPREELHILALLVDHPNLMQRAEEKGVFSLLTDDNVRAMYSAAQKGGSVVEHAAFTPEIAEQVLSGTYAHIKDENHCLDEAVAVLEKNRARKGLADLQNQAKVAKRRGDVELERQLVRQIVAARRQVD